MTHLFDSSAFMALFFGEPGRARVEELLLERGVSAGLSVVTAVESWGRLRAEGREDAFASEWDDYSELFALVDVTARISPRAVELRCATAARLPAVDALIAATAAVHDAVLVHCNPHFAPIPSHLLRQEKLPDT